MERILNKEKLPETERHESMRGYFAHALYNEMAENEDIVVVTADLGFAMLDKIRDNFPDRFINVGAREQSAIGIAVGMSYEGKLPFVYTISSFYMRAAEQIDLYIAKEKAPVILVGGGRDNDYEHDGVSHWAYTTQDYMKQIGIPIIAPETNQVAANTVRLATTTREPMFVSLRR